MSQPDKRIRNVKPPETSGLSPAEITFLEAAQTAVETGSSWARLADVLRTHAEHVAPPDTPRTDPKEITISAGTDRQGQPGVAVAWGQMAQVWNLTYARGVASTLLIVSESARHLACVRRFFSKWKNQQLGQEIAASLLPYMDKYTAELMNEWTRQTLTPLQNAAL